MTLYSFPITMIVGLLLAGALTAASAAQPAQAAINSGVLTLTNGSHTQSWQLGNGIITSAKLPDVTGAWQWKIVRQSPQALPVSAKATIVEIEGVSGDQRASYQFRYFDGIPAFELTRAARPGDEVASDAVVDTIAIPTPSDWTFTSVSLMDNTDHNDDLVKSAVHKLDGGAFEEKTNLAYLERNDDGSGTIFVKMAPLPHARAIKIDHDFTWDGKLLQWHGPGVNSISGHGYACATIPYSGGRAGRIAALQDYYRCLRQYKTGRDGLIISNTWGDRNGDSKISEKFLLDEIKAGKALGIDVMQVDDGWQKGASKNSSTVTRSNQGVWSGFWKTDPEFWTPNLKRLPNGLEPVAKAAKEAGMHLGLWYAPDSADDFSNWKRDADRILDLHRQYGVDYFKLDSITMMTPMAEQNVKWMLERITTESQGVIVTDLDVTAGVRPGYLGAIESGPVFVENRYTDWKNYWPHLTLRNFWSLAEHVDPVRLRMEFLNNTRSQKAYEKFKTSPEKGPLVPSAYSPGYLFASIMFSSPLAWFEVSELPDAYANEAGGLIKIWKEHRSNIQSGNIIPVGKEPDGNQWTGFVSIAKDRKSGYAVILREVNDIHDWQMPIPLMGGQDVQVKILSGTGKATYQDGQLHLSIPESKGYVFLQFQR